MDLLDRIKAESTALGKVFTLKIPILLGFIAGAAETLEYTNTLPEGIVPVWLKTGLLIAVGISKFFGHLTVKNNENT
jgi:hypothetical protein